MPFGRSRNERRTLRVLAKNRCRTIEARVLPAAGARGPGTAASNTANFRTDNIRTDMSMRVARASLLGYYRPAPRVSR